MEDEGELDLFLITFPSFFPVRLARPWTCWDISQQHLQPQLCLTARTRARLGKTKQRSQGAFATTTTADRNSRKKGVPMFSVYALEFAFYVENAGMMREGAGGENELACLSFFIEPCSSLGASPRPSLLSFSPSSSLSTPFGACDEDSRYRIEISQIS